MAALVYIAAFAPDKGESVATLTDLRPGASVSPVLPPQDGFLFQDLAEFPAWFGADIPAGQAEFMADSQVPWGLTPSAAPSASRHGAPSRAGTSSPSTTG
ncbi:MAG TPA: hypothetical protein VK501_14115 [Baekduia sp.]|nr:hypothetical protein [Baekduia sp.]HMJ35042.1 hypothetical protein [Baekduia sp.]